ncbi:MAG: hypothetical protein ACK6CU_05930 [Deltaproteobacteria bacterium]
MKSSLDALREALAAMSPADIDPAPGLDASQAAGIVMGSLPRIAKHREAIVERFGAEGTAIIDGLADVAYATEQANVEVASADAISDLSAMHADLLEEHALLLGDATALANRKLIERNRLDAGRPILGYRPSITSTLVLVSLFREHWAVVAGKTPLREADLDRAERKAKRMLALLNEREQGSTRLAAADLRSRAVSMLIRQYGEVRRMLTYVRWWNDDADQIAPSLWSGRRGKNRKEVVEPVTPPVVDEDGEPSEPVVTTGTPSPVNGGGPFAA